MSDFEVCPVGTLAQLVEAERLLTESRDDVVECLNEHLNSGRKNVQLIALYEKQISDIDKWLAKTTDSAPKCDCVNDYERALCSVCKPIRHTDSAPAVHEHKFTMSFQTGELKCSCGMRTAPTVTADSAEEGAK